MISARKKILLFLCAGLTLCLGAWAQCPVDTIVVSGRVQNSSSDSKVRVQLVYPKGKPGESGEVTVSDGSFRIPLEFVTEQSSIFTNLPKRCGRRPKSVEISLIENDREADRVSLDFSRSFRLVDASAYALRSEVVLKGTR